MTLNCLRHMLFHIKVEPATNDNNLQADMCGLETLMYGSPSSYPSSSSTFSAKTVSAQLARAHTLICRPVKALIVRCVPVLVCTVEIAQPVLHRLLQYKQPTARAVNQWLSSKYRVVSTISTHQSHSPVVSQVVRTVSKVLAR